MRREYKAPETVKRRSSRERSRLLWWSGVRGGGVEWGGEWGEHSHTGDLFDTTVLHEKEIEREGEKVGRAE